MGNPEEYAERQLRQILGSPASPSPEVAIPTLTHDATGLGVGQAGKRVGKWGIYLLGSLLERYGKDVKSPELEKYGSAIVRGIIAVPELIAFYLVTSPNWRWFIFGTVWEQIDYICDSVEAFASEALKK